MITNDIEDPRKIRCQFGVSADIDDAFPPTNLVIEVRVGDDPSAMPLSRYWTAFGLYDPNGNLNRGRWRLPLYATPTNP
jgi:hypothetical protein